MATVGNANSPYIQGSLELIDAFPFGELVSLVDTVDSPGVVSLLSSYFPSPPAAFGFLITPENQIDQSGIVAPHVIAGAFYPEGVYTEPTLGQIWPR